MSRESARVSWQREIYQSYSFPVRRKRNLTDHFRVTALLLALALCVNTFLFTAIREKPNNGYLLLMEQHLPGMGKWVESQKNHSGKAGNEESFLTVKDIFTRFIIGNELAGFRGIALTQQKHTPETNYTYNENNNFHDFKERTPPADESSLSFLVSPGTKNTEDQDIPSQELPKILIYHTHTTESFLAVSGQPFTSDLQQSVVFLGELLAQMLEENYGIPVLHHREIFDIPRSSAYEQARPVIAEIINENPQLELVVDLHRDGISREITTFSLNEKNTARILFVVGTRHEGWNSNLRFALFLQNQLDTNYPGLCRGVRRQNVTYNQHLHPRSVLVEIGGHENTKAEVLQTMPYLAETLASAFED